MLICLLTETASHTVYSRSIDSLSTDCHFLSIFVLFIFLLYAISNFHTHTETDKQKSQLETSCVGRLSSQHQHRAHTNRRPCRSMAMVNHVTSETYLLCHRCRQWVNECESKDAKRDGVGRRQQRTVLLLIFLLSFRRQLAINTQGSLCWQTRLWSAVWACH